MQITEKEFSVLWQEVSDICKTCYGIEVGKNATFVAETIFNQHKKNTFSYVECGVYKGTTFFPIYYLCKKIFNDFTMYALDSFSGFPEESILNENDEFEKFEILFQQGRITKDHLEMARERCKILINKEHLQTGYFKNYADDFFEKCADKKEINIAKCSFNDLETKFISDQDKYDLVFLDCDLYLSYKQCLNFFKDRTDIFVFDEYYSLKYPGARIACDEFVERNSGWEFFNKLETNPSFERWGIIRKQGERVNILPK